MSDSIATPTPKPKRSFPPTALFRPRILIGLIVWMLLLHAIALALIAWYAVASHDTMSAQVAADAARGDSSASPEWHHQFWAKMTRGLLVSYLFGLAPIVTLFIGVALVAVGKTVRGGTNGWLWTIGGALAGACTGWSNVYLALTIIALLGVLVSPEILMESWVSAAAGYFLHWQTLSNFSSIAICTILGIVSASILRRIALGRTAGARQAAAIEGRRCRRSIAWSSNAGSLRRHPRRVPHHNSVLDLDCARTIHTGGSVRVAWHRRSVACRIGSGNSKPLRRGALRCSVVLRRLRDTVAYRHHGGRRRARPCRL
ncbi:MAG TPA: hypothetical protein VH835_04725 [Dongiaceae bacterium]|jgi:hypothetical protein